MMKFFIGQAVTGEDENKLKEECYKIQDILSKKGYESYCTINPKDNLNIKNPKDWLMHAFDEIEECDAFFGIIRSEKRSEGMLIEIGYTLSKNKKLIIAIKEDVKDKTYVDELANIVIVFKDIHDLYNKLRELEL